MPHVLLQTYVDEETFRRASARAEAENKSLERVLAASVKRFGARKLAKGKKARGKRLRTPRGVAPISRGMRFGLAAVEELPSPPGIATDPNAPAFQLYTVQTGDTLSAIAKKFYGNSAQFAVIAQANNISDFRKIFPGQELKIPTIAPAPTPLPQPPAPTPPPEPGTLKPGPFPGYPPIPDGLEQIKQVFGEFEFVNDPNNPANITITDGWDRQNIVLQNDVPLLPHHRIRCHKLLAPIFVNVFTEIQHSGLSDLIHSYDGCFFPRHKMHDPTRDLSVHSWGIAIDINASTNQPGTKGDMDPRVIEIFQAHGFYWGGNFADPMHFQYCANF
jgi:LysM repeat protein